jgi:hypothetical protein
VTALADPFVAAVWVAKLAALAMLISSLEYMARPRTIADEGLLSWEVSRLRYPWLIEGVTARVLDGVLAYPNVLGLIATRASFSALVLLAPSSLTSSPWLVIPLAVSTLLLLLRSNYGLDGADQMAWIIIAGLALTSLSGSSETRAAYLWFIALQSCLSYLVAGVAEASAADWRSGAYLSGIFRTRIYGNLAFARLVTGRPRVAALLARGVIAWECSFVLVLIAPMPMVMLMLAGGVVFHLTTAYLMGLNAFFWAFVATYPAIMYCAHAGGW